MTTPAQTINAPVSDITVRYYRNGVFMYSVPGGVGFARQLRPASVTSPKRPDGSRPPQAWEHSWGNVQGIVRTVEINIGATWRLEDSPLFEGTVVPSSVEEASRWLRPYQDNSYFPSACYYAAVTKVRIKIQDQKLSLGTTLAEIRETAGTIVSGCELVLGVVERASLLPGRLKRKAIWEILMFGKTRPRKPRESKRSSERRIALEKRVLDLWLGAQFGVKPLVSDIQDIGQALSDSLFVRQRAARCTAQAGANTEDFVTVKFHNGFYPSFTVDFPCVLKTQCHFSLVYELPLSPTRTFDQLGLTNPAEVLYEVIPFSWVVDYFTTTGKWIQSLVPIDGLQFIEGSCSRVQRLLSLSGGRVVPETGVTIVSGGSSFNGEVVMGRFVREVLTSVPLPSLRPTMKNRLNLVRLANVLAAVAQVSSSR